MTLNKWKNWSKLKITCPSVSLSLSLFFIISFLLPYLFFCHILYYRFCIRYLLAILLSSWSLFSFSSSFPVAYFKISHICSIYRPFTLIFSNLDFSLNTSSNVSSFFILLIYFYFFLLVSFHIPSPFHQYVFSLLLRLSSFRQDATCLRKSLLCPFFITFSFWSFASFWSFCLLFILSFLIPARRCVCAGQAPQGHSGSDRVAGARRRRAVLGTRGTRGLGHVPVRMVVKMMIIMRKIIQ